MRAILGERQGCTQAVEQRQALTQVAQPGTAAHRLRHADAGVADPQPHLVVDTLAPDLDATALLARVDAVAHRVLDQRQQRHRREAQAAEFGRQVHEEVQSVRHAQVHQFEVGAHQGQFVRQRGGVALQARHRGAQVGDQAAQHRRRLRRAGFHQRPDIGQGVEQEMRLDLRLQQPQPGVQRLAFQLAALQLEAERLAAGFGIALAVQRAHGQQRADDQAGAGDPQEAEHPGFGLDEAGEVATDGDHVDRQGGQRHGRRDHDHLEQPARPPARQPARPLTGRRKGQQRQHADEHRPSQQHREGRDEDRLQRQREDGGQRERQQDPLRRQVGDEAVPGRMRRFGRVGGKDRGRHARTIAAARR